MIRIAIVEDEINESDNTKKMIERYAIEKSVQIGIKVFNSSVNFISSYKSEYDVIFLDIQMPVFDGMETAEKVRTMDSKVIIIFVTNMENYAIKGYSVAATDFIVKPLVYPQLAAVMDKICDRISLREKSTLTFSTKDGTRRILTEEIVYIETQKHKLFIHMVDKKTHEVWGNLTETEAALPPIFVRINACYLVNLYFIKGGDREFALVGDEQLKISRNKKQEFYNKWVIFIGEN